MYPGSHWLSLIEPPEAEESRGRAPTATASASSFGRATSVIDDAWTFGSDDEVLFRHVKGEIPEQAMPTVYSVLEDEEVLKILAFIRSVYAGDPGRIDW